MAPLGHPTPSSHSAALHNVRNPAKNVRRSHSRSRIDTVTVIKSFTDNPNVIRRHATSFEVSERVSWSCWSIFEQINTNFGAAAVQSVAAVYETHAKARPASEARSDWRTRGEEGHSGVEATRSKTTTTRAPIILIEHYASVFLTRERAPTRPRQTRFPNVIDSWNHLCPGRSRALAAGVCRQSRLAPHTSSWARHTARFTLTWPLFSRDCSAAYRVARVARS